MNVCPLLLASALACSATLHAQLGFTETFDGPDVPNGWAETGHYSVSVAEGALVIDVSKSAPWEGLSYSLGGSIDISANPVVTTRIKTENPMELSVYIFSPDGGGGFHNDLITRRVFALDGYQTITWDFGDTSLEGNDGDVDLSDVTLMQLTVAGATVSYDGKVFLDELRAGSDATARANFTAPPDYSAYQGTGGHRIRIADIENASAVNASGAGGLIENVSATAIGSTARTGDTAFVEFDARAGVSGTETLTITAIGANGKSDYSFDIEVTVEENLAPTIGTSDDIEAQAGVERRVELSGITDGNVTQNQDLNLSAVSSDQGVLADGSFSFEHEGESPYATLSFTPLSAGTTTVTVTVAEGGLSATTTFAVDVFDSLNGAPTISDPGGVTVFADQPGRIELTGVTDGDGGTQGLTVTAVSQDEAKIPNPITARIDGEMVILEVEATAELGFVDVLVTLGDDGGAAGNNGNQSTELTVRVELIPEPANGYVIPLDTLTFAEDRLTMPVDTWVIEGQDTVQDASVVTKDGELALRIVCTEKSTWTGTWYAPPDVDVTDMPAMSFEVLLEGIASIGVHAYFWDDAGERNTDGAHAARQTVPEGVWTKFEVDYNQVENGLVNGEGEPINTERIQQILLNYHPNFDWPFTDASFTVYFRNIRFGDEAEVTVTNPEATLDGVPDQVFTASAQAQEHTLLLTGISNGIGGKATVAATSSGDGVLSNLSVTDTTAEGEALVRFTTTDTTGTARVTLTASAGGSQDAVERFDVTVEDGGAVTVTVDTGTQYQEIRGFGTFMFNQNSYVPLYGEMGGSAMRIGFIQNQLEVVNDNSDPYVIDRSKLNYGALPWERMRQLKAVGVETWILTYWTPPEWMKLNLSDDYQGPNVIPYETTDNILDPYYFEEFAESVVIAYKVIKEETGIELTGIGPQNEPAFHEPYGSATLSPEAFADVIAVLGPRLETEGISMKIFMPEQVFSQNFYSMAEYMAAVRANAVANEYTDVIATHGYASDGVGAGQPDFSAWETMVNNAQSGAYPKELWMTETFPEYSGWDSALNYAMYLYGSLSAGNINLWTSWAIENQLISIAQPLQSFYTFKNYAKYVRPGAMRVGVSNGHDDLYVTAYEDTANNLLTVVAVNLGQTPVLLDLDDGGAASDAWVQYTTSNGRGFARMGSTSSLATMPSRSVSTFVAPLQSPVAAPEIVSDLSLEVAVGEAVAYTLEVDGLATTLEALNVPSGFAFDAGSGTLYGIASAEQAYSITVRAGNGAGTDEETLLLTVGAATNLAPVANFSADVTTGFWPLEVNFDASLSSDLDGSIDSYAWDFDDGSQETGVTVTKTFTTPGSYDVQLTVTDNSGATATRTQTISVLEQPSITFRVAGNDVTDLEVPAISGQRAVTISTDPAGQDWTLVSDQPWVSFSVVSGTGQGLTAVRYEANDTGAERTATVSVYSDTLTVTQAAPDPLVITTESTYEYQVGDTLDISLEAAGGIAPYAWSVESGPAFVTLDDANLSGLLETSGSYAIEVEVSDALGTTATATISLVVEELDVGLLNPWKDLTSVNGFKDTSEAGYVGMGWIFDGMWPWVFAYGVDMDYREGGDWIWVYIAGEEPVGSKYWAYNYAGDIWMWCQLEWGWYWMAEPANAWEAFTY